MITTVLALAALAAAAPGAGASDERRPAASPATGDGPTVHALVVASSEGGDGQSPLAHATDDARAVEAVLTELGRAEVTRLVDPTPAEVEQAIAQLRARLERGRDPSSMFVFYYSGHARAQAIDLGSAPLSLERLRAALDTVPATVRLVVLDACQSGAYSAVKGAAPAAQFTMSSARALATEGSAVIASSTGSELSQESPELGGSYFTHHWVVGLRGAGDANQDGRVTLREAYDYAYHHTLISTAQTAIGRQHPVLETRLKGHGDVVLAYPAEARAHLDIASAEATSVLVATKNDVVMAEVHAPAGVAVRLALPAGAYVAWARGANERRRCAVTLQDGIAARVDPAQCPVVADPRTAAKGGDAYDGPTWGFELGWGIGQVRDDAYVDALGTFGFGHTFDLAAPFRLRGSVVRWLFEQLAVVVSLDLMDQRSFFRDTVGSQGDEASFDFSVWSVTAGARLGTELGAAWSVYGQAGVGLGMGFTALGEFDDTYFAPVLRLAGGFDRAFGDHFALYLQLGWSTARVISNLNDQTHESGGFDGGLGVRVQL